MSEYYFYARDKSTNVRVLSAGRKATHHALQFLWRWAPRFTQWMALRLFFSPGVYPVSAEEKECLGQGQPFKIRVHDKTISAWRWGHGPAVLLVHGWSGRGIQFHRFVVPLVKAGYTAIAIDMPAHGESTGRITSYFEFTDAIRAFLSKDQALGVQGIIAHSLGACATINALAKEKIAINTVCIAPVLRLRELLLNTFVRFGIPHVIFTALISEFEKRFGYNLEADNPLGLLPYLRGPVLMVHDENDRTVAFGDTADQAQNHARITLFATQGLGHRRLLTDDTVVRACLDHMGKQHVANTATLTTLTGD